MSIFSRSTLAKDGDGPRTRQLLAVGALCALTAMVGTVIVPAAPAQAAPAVQQVTVRGADVAAAAESVNALTFKGFGVLSGNSTSSLLLDYKSQHPDKYWELIETLFGGDHPIMNTVKLEMGNDRNTSTGSSAATMRSRDEYPNVLRDPSWQLAADAEKVSKGEVHVSVLRWKRPAWVKTDADQYIWFKNSILAAYREHGIMVDSINPDENETPSPRTGLYKTFSGWLRADTKGYEGAKADDPNNGFRSATERNLYRSIKTIAADTVSTPPTYLGDELNSPTDPSLRDAVDIVGFHYASRDDSKGNLRKFATTYDKEIWNSEGQSTFGSTADRPNNTNSTGEGGSGTEMGGTQSALQLSNWVTTGFAQSLRTLNIFQPAIGSYYEGMQYGSKELVSARDPWSGWLSYDGGLATLEHYTQFADLGWENADNTAGIWRGIPQASGSALTGGNPPGGASRGASSYMTLADPDASDFSTVMVNDSPYDKTYTITTSGMKLGTDTTMEVWETRAADAGEAYDANYLAPVQQLTPSAAGTYTVTLKPWSTATATTLDHAAKAADGSLTARDGYGSTLPTSPEFTTPDGARPVLDTDAAGALNGVTTDTTLYADDFDYAGAPNIKTYDPATGQLSTSSQTFLGSRGGKAKPAGTPNLQPEDNSVIPRYTNDTNGAFESVTTADTTHGRVLRQQIGTGMIGGYWNNGDPKTTIGDHRWANYRASVDVLFEAGGTPYATLGVRQQGGTGNGQKVSASEIKIDQNGTWSLLKYGTEVASGKTSDVPAAAFKTGTGVWNNLAVKAAGSVYTVFVNGVEITSYSDPAPQAAGRIQLGSAFTHTQFDNLKIERVPGFTPYYSDVIDGMHQTSWDDVSAPVLQFDSKWSHTNAADMYDTQRTASKTTGKGASLTYTFTGTGLDVSGINDGTARLDVLVDGVQVVTDAPTLKASRQATTFALRGLPSGAHTVTIRTSNDGVLNVDAVGVVRGSNDSGSVDTTALRAVLAKANALVQSDWTPQTWAPFAALREMTRKTVASPSAVGLDAEGAAAQIGRLVSSTERLAPVAISDDVRDLGIASRTGEQGLPGTLVVDGAERAVTYDAGVAQAFASATHSQTITATGRTSAKVASSGVYQRFTLALVVAPADLRYFIDSGSNGAGTPSAFAAVKAAQKGVVNGYADRTWDGKAAGRTWGYSTNSPGTVVVGNAADWGSSYVPADVGAPVTYHLSLPAGAYEVTTVQAPRPGITTNVTSTVTSGTTSETATAVSTGGATPITQLVTLAAPAVVDVAFGTNGTSGYNARLALVTVSSVPRDLGFQGAVTSTAALPATVTVDGRATAVTWSSDSVAATRTEFETLDVTGSISDGSTVTAQLEVVPESLVYFIDSATGETSSPQFDAVVGAVPGLLNAVSDRSSSGAGQWGYVATGTKVKGGTDVNDKYSTGFYQDTTEMVYRLPLAAGTYTLTGGFTEWFDKSRSLNQTVSANGQELAKGGVALSAGTPRLSADLTFTLDAATTVEYRVTNEGAGSEKPVISWLAVDKG